MLKYILDNPRGSITWLPFDNVSMLSLSKKGLIKLAGALPAIRRSWSSYTKLINGLKKRAEQFNRSNSEYSVDVNKTLLTILKK